jgi:hypothetical protein
MCGNGSWHTYGMRSVLPLEPGVTPLLFSPLCSVSRRPIWAGTRSDNLLVGLGTPRGRNTDTLGLGCCRWAHRTVRVPPDTVRCASHVTQSLGFERCRPLELLSSSGTEQSGAAPDRYCSLSGAPLTSAHCSSLFTESAAFAVDRCTKEPLLRWCTGQSGGTPDSPVNYSGARPEKPEGGEFGIVRSWCTGHCPVAHRTVRCARPGHPWFLCSFDFEP